MSVATSCTWAGRGPRARRSCTCAGRAAWRGRRLPSASRQHMFAPYMEHHAWSKYRRRRSEGPARPPACMHAQGAALPRCGPPPVETHLLAVELHKGPPFRHPIFALGHVHACGRAGSEFALQSSSAAHYGAQNTRDPDHHMHAPSLGSRVRAHGRRQSSTWRGLLLCYVRGRVPARSCDGCTTHHPSVAMRRR